MTVQLSVAMIVKDESAHLPGCLASVAALGDLIGEVCIYDTGSADDSVAIARRFGARVTEGYWDGDFARARNESLAMTSAPWAVILDADEEFAADPAALRHLLRTTTADVINAQVIHLDDAGLEIGRSWCGKIVRHPQTAYQGRVHEVAQRVDGQPTATVSAAPGTLSFPHHGYRNRQVRAGKAARNAASSQGEVASARASGDPGRLALALYHRGRSSVLLGQADAARADLSEAYALFPPGCTAKDRAASSLLGVLLDAGQLAEAMAVVREHQRTGAPADVIRLLLARLSLASGQYEAVRTLTRAISPSGDPERDVDPRIVLELRLAAAAELSRHDEALSCCLALYGGHAESARLPEILERTRGESAGTVARLLDGLRADEELLRDLRTQGERGQDIIAALQALRRACPGQPG